MSRIQRRDALKSMFAFSAASSALLRSQASASETMPQRTGLGLVMYCVRIRRDALKAQGKSPDLFEPLALLKHCRALGAGGMQCSLGAPDAEEAKELRAFAERHQLYIEGIVSLPKDKADAERFTAEIRSAKQAGALAVRATILSGRRYETFDDLETYKQHAARGREMLERAAPIVEKLQLPLAIENHKDQRNDERIQLLSAINSEYVGACLDTGNSLALLEDPIQTIRDFVPWTHSVHLKDQSLELNDQGFLLGDVPLGQGSLDLREMVRIIRQVRPHVRFSLELITRDPLQVPCLSEKYWATFPELPAKHLAKALTYIRDHASHNGQFISRLSPEEQLAREDANIRESLNYARIELGI